MQSVSCSVGQRMCVAIVQKLATDYRLLATIQEGGVGVQRYLLVLALIGCIGTGGISVASAAGTWMASLDGIKMDAAAPGWPGAKAAYLGRYRLISSSDAALARRGELTVFLRKVPGEKMPALSGILAVHGPAG